MTENIDSIIKLAWHDKSSFEKIHRLYGVSETEVIFFKIESFILLVLANFHHHQKDIVYLTALPSVHFHLRNYKLPL